MSAQSLRLAGFKRLLRVSGEPLLFGQLSIRGLVNRTPGKLKDVIASTGNKATLDFSTLGMTQIEVLQTATPLPVAGQSFIDGYDTAHRIRYVTKTDITWACFCQPSPRPQRGGIIGVGGEGLAGVGGEGISE